MDGSVLKSLSESIQQIVDPRVSGRSDHLLVDLEGITILAVLCGADDFVAVATFAKHRREWLRQFFQLPAGVPSHDTFARVLGLLDPKQFSAALVNWTSAASPCRSCGETRPPNSARKANASKPLSTPTTSWKC